MSGFQVSDSGNPVVTGCKIHDGKMGGVFVLDNGRGEFRNCEIYRNLKPGFAVKSSGNPTVIGCKIHDGKTGGVYVYEGGRGTFNNNTVENNYTNDQLDNWDIASDAGEVNGYGNTPPFSPPNNGGNNDDQGESRIDRY